MKKAMLLYGPSGSGKTALARKISKKYGFKHCDTDYFMLAFSPKPSKERSQIAVNTCYSYAKELINNDRNIITEALSPPQIRALKRLLKYRKYKVIEISLVNSLDNCLKNNMTRTDRKFPKGIIKRSHKKHSYRKGLVVDVSKMSPNQVFKIIESKFLR